MRRLLTVYGLILAVFFVLAVPSQAETVAAFGRLDTSGNPAFTIDDSHVFDARSDAKIQARTVRDMELITATEETLTSADSGKVLIATATSTTTFTLPDAAEDLEFSIVAGQGQTVKVDPATTDDTIYYLTLDGGDEIDSAGASADSVTIRYYKANTWIPVQMKGSWTDGGSS